MAGCLQITPIQSSLSAIVNIPGSKSLTNRALLVSALTNGVTRLTNALFSDDSRYFADALVKLGFQVNMDIEKKEISISGCSGRIPATEANLFIGNAGTAARFLSAFLTLGQGEFVLDGDSRMRERPIGDLVLALTQLGANLSSSLAIPKCENGIYPPVKIVAAGLPGGKAIISGKISSQFLSALLMVAPYAKSPVEITVIDNLNSKPYVDMTLGVMSDFGVSVSRNDYTSFFVNNAQYHAIECYEIEPDASAASYFFAAPALLGGYTRINKISRSSKQGDIAFIDVLQKMGCKITDTASYVQVHGPSSLNELQGVDVDMRDIPDTAQTLAALAPFASSPTNITGIESARMKECDRVSATCAELKKIGVRVEEHTDGMTIYPCHQFTPTTIGTYNDHRMAMSFALIGLRIPGISIENPDCVTKTFPDYFKVLESLR